MSLRDTVPNAMLERAARALCVLEGCDPDALHGEADDAVACWRNRVRDVEVVLQALMLPSLSRVAADGDGSSAPDPFPDWSAYRKEFGAAGAWAREPALATLTGWHVQAAWRTWNGMIAYALSDAWPTPTGTDRLDAVSVGAPQESPTRG